MADAGLAPAVAALQRALSRIGARHMLIGGVAVIARGIRRLTDDVDATLWADGVDLGIALDHLAKEGIVPRIPDAIDFARQSQVLLLRHRASRIDVDLSLAWLPFESAALDRADKVRIGRLRVSVASADDLIVYKAIASRERDRSDVERLLELHGKSIDLARVRHIVRELAEALERPDLVEGLESIIRKVGAGPAKSRKPAPKRGRPRRRT